MNNTRQPNNRFLPRANKQLGHPPEINNLVLEGGSVAGLAYAGAFEQLATAGKLSGVDKVAGASAGSWAALFLSLGMHPKDIAAISEFDFNDLLKTTPWYKGGILGDIRQVLARYGYHDPKALRKFIADKVEKTLGKPNATFMDLHKAVLEQNQYPERHTNAQKFRDVSIAITNVSSGQSEICSWQTTPDLPLADAAMMSAAIPLFFRAVFAFKDDDGQFIMGKDGFLKTGSAGDTGAIQYVDGGMLNNLPANVFEDDGRNPRTLALRVDRKATIDWLKHGISPDGHTPGSLPANLKRLIELSVKNGQTSTRPQQDNGNTIFIPVPDDINMLDFSLSESQREALLNNGQQAVNDFFAAQAQHYTSPYQRHTRRELLDIAAQKDRQLLYFAAKRHAYAGNAEQGHIRLTFADKQLDEVQSLIQHLHGSQGLHAFDVFQTDQGLVLDMQVDPTLIVELNQWLKQQTRVADFIRPLPADARPIEHWQAAASAPLSKTEKAQQLLHLLVTGGSMAAIEILIDSGAQLCHRDPQTGQTALHVAVLNRRQDAVIKLFAQISPDLLNAQDAQGNTGLHYAVMNKDARLVELLLVQGAKLDLRNQEGFSAQQLANKLNASDMSNAITRHREFVANTSPAETDYPLGRNGHGMFAKKADCSGYFAAMRGDAAMSDSIDADPVSLVSATHMPTASAA